MKTIEIRGIKFRSDLGGVIGGKLAAGVMYEGDMLKYIERLNFEGDCVDVGCFIGTHSLYFAKRLNKKVYSFDWDNVDIFHDHVKMNNVNNVYHYPFWLNPPLELNNYVNSRIGLIKIDVDGSDEIDVLKSCSKVIDRDHPHIFIEARTKEKLREIENYLINYNNIEVFNATPTYYFRHNAYVLF